MVLVWSIIVDSKENFDEKPVMTSETERSLSYSLEGESIL